MRTQRLCIGLLPILGMALPGCSGDRIAVDKAAVKVGRAATAAQQLKEIEDNPHMPPAAKEAARATILQNQNREGPRGLETGVTK
ncbi:MAG TPA: hypothetical protein VFB21_10450 [Chthonomonadaceae bacterium]|nr:hypothetical protein [Chthonomonadaceae bacterium]